MIFKYIAKVHLAYKNIPFGFTMEMRSNEYRVFIYIVKRNTEIESVGHFTVLSDMCS